MTCCGENHTSQFCPNCGKKLMHGDAEILARIIKRMESGVRTERTTAIRWARDADSPEYAAKRKAKSDAKILRMEAEIGVLKKILVGIEQ